MKRYPFAIGVTVIGALAAWWMLPWRTSDGKVDLAMLGPPEACACAPMPSPPLRKWAACAVTELDKAKRLEDAIFDSGVGVWYNIDKSKVPSRFDAAIREVVEPSCGKYDSALALANVLQTKRRTIGFEEYLIVDSAAGMFANWPADELRSQAHEAIPKVGSDDA